ncbi:DUF3090 domain-containing protein [Anaerolineales bacterium]
MPKSELDLNPLEFITIGTIGPKGKRVFHLQAGYDNRIISFTIEKEQAGALAEAINEFMDDLDGLAEDEELSVRSLDLELREPITPIFRVATMGLGYDETNELVILIVQELLSQEQRDNDEEPSVVRMWCTTGQIRALSIQAMYIVKAGRPDPRQNGRIIYYWT